MMFLIKLKSFKQINYIQNLLKLNYRFFSLTQNHNKIDCILSTIGSEGCGKSTLTDVLKKVSLNKFNYEISKDISYGPNNVIFSKYCTDQSNIVHIDCPGSVNGMKNLLSNTYANDFCIVVIDATKGILNQTKEQIICTNHMDKKDFIIFINKTDLCDNQTVELIQFEIKEFFKSIDINLDEESIFYGSALKLNEENNTLDNKCILSLLDYIDKKTKNLLRNKNELFKFSIRKSFLKTNKGTEVTGNFKSGNIKKGDNAFIAGYDRHFRTIIQDIESFRKPLVEVLPGTSASLLLKSIKRNDLERGMLIYSPKDKSIQISDNLIAELYILPKNIKNDIESIDTSKRFLVHGRTFQIAALLISDQEKLYPEKKNLVKFKLIKSMPLEVGLKFILRENSTVGLGTIKEILPSAVTELLNKSRK